MTDGAQEGRVLLRESKRAVRHSLIQRIGVPVIGVGGVMVVAGTLDRVRDGAPFEAAFFGLGCGAAVVWAWRKLWRMAKR